MTIEECYRQLDGDFALAQKQLTSKAMVERFIVRFLQDDSFASLGSAMEDGSREAAFRAAHTLKGVSGTLGLCRLYASASQLTELLRPEARAIPADARTLFEIVKQDYRITEDAIRAYRDSDG
ncbi:MAG: Hpt domain-containing protein [Candidatus Ventricola sp.]